MKRSDYDDMGIKLLIAPFLRSDYKVEKAITELAGKKPEPVVAALQDPEAGIRHGAAEVLTDIGRSHGFEVEGGSSLGRSQSQFPTGG
jgi:hypothetical protein